MQAPNHTGAGSRPVGEYACYLFDMDGTLMDTSELIYRSFLHTLVKYRRPRPARAEVVAGIGLPLKNQFEQFTGPMTEPEFLRVYETYNTYQKKLAPRYLSVFPGVDASLRELKGHGKKLAVVTSRKKLSLESYLALKGLDIFFDALITPESTLRHKPHPEPVLKALAELGAQPGETLFIGDSIWDMDAAYAAGVDTAFVAWSNTDPASLAVHPTYVLRDMRELSAPWVS